MPNPCPSCGDPVEQRHDVGRPRIYCGNRCKATATRRRARAEREHLRAVYTAARRAGLDLPA